MKRQIEVEEEVQHPVGMRNPLIRMRMSEPINFREILLAIDLSHKTVMQKLTANGKFIFFLC
jgi:hypothetical protein